MSTINQIERSLQEIDATKFHKLVDAYLNKKYAYDINSSGTKLAEDKPKKGTPDTCISLDNGNYVFAEYTTQKRGIVNKFLQDIDKCFDKEKTGIAVDKIEKIILACNSDLNPSEIENLKAKCKEQNIDCMVLGNSTIANNLFNHYPNIAKEFLSISIDSGQILDYDDFIQNYNSNKFSTSLNTSLLCREKEFKNLYKDIANSAIVLVTGAAGVGKTKLALEVCKKYAKESNFIFKGILNRGANIFDDIMSHFSDKEKSYLVLIDDVNRVHIALEYIQSYYGEKFQNGKLKIVATVRDYAKEKVLQENSHLNLSEFELKALDDKSIEQIVKDEYNIINPSYLERIVDISQGNPRLALMASSIAEERNDLSALYDVSSLYEQYFSNIKKDLDFFNQDDILLTIVIVAFFRMVDKNNQEQCQLIETVFNVSISELWKHVEDLHNLEIFDLYENEVVKISDQILSTYLFYKIVFVDKKVPIDVFLENFFPQYKEKFTDVLNPLLNTFDSQHIVNTLKYPVNQLWNKHSSHERNLYHVMDVFWFLKQTDILIYFREKINDIANEEFDINSLDFWTRRNTNAINDEILKQFVVFQYDNTQTTKSITQLILTYFEKRPSIFLDVLQILGDEYGFKYESNFWRYEKEKGLLDTIWQYCDNGKNELICKLFIQISKEFLRTDFKDIKSKGHEFTWRTFKLPETDELKKIKNNIFECLSTLCQDKKYKNDIVRLIKEYPSGITLQHGISEVEKWDGENIVKLIQDNFDPSIYKHVKAVNDCLDGFDRRGISYSLDIRNKFQHPIYALEKIITLDSVEISLENPREKGEKTDWSEVDKIKKDRLAKLVENYSLPDWELLFDRCDVIFNNSSDNYKIQENLVDLFRILAKQNQSLYTQVFEKYLELSNPFSINPNLTDLINILGKEQAYQRLQKYSYNLKNIWLFRFFQDLPNNLIHEDDIKIILNLYQNTEIQSVPYCIDFLTRYLSIEPDIFIKVAQILIGRDDNENESFINGLKQFFNSYADISKNLEVYFENDLELLEQIYLLCLGKGDSFDYDASFLNQLIDLDNSFIERFIQKIFDSKEYISSYDINIDFTILWSRDDYEIIFLKMLEAIFDTLKSNEKLAYAERLSKFLSYSENSQEIKNKADIFIKKYIDKYSQDETMIVFIFEYVSKLSYKCRKEFICYLLQKNDSYKLFKALPLQPSSFSWSGSRVPHLQKDKDFFKSLLEYISDIRFLGHRQYLEREISCVEKQIEYEKKQDFMEDY